MPIPIFGPLIAAFSTVGGKWLDKQIVVSEGAIEVAKAKAHAEATVQIKKATAEIDWEQTMAAASNNSWKDELWTIFFVVILTTAFIPGMETYISQGFAVIATLPEWFGTAVLVAIGAAFGRNIVRDVQNLKVATKTMPTKSSSSKLRLRK